MADAFTSNFDLVLQVTGSNSGSWGTDLNNNLISPLDTILGGTQPITMSNANVTLSIAQWQNKAFKITGTLLANVSLILPLSPNAVGGTPSVGGEFVVDNRTTGAFTITVLTAATGSTGVTVPQGARASLYSDTVNVWYANDAFGIPAGTGADFFGATAPAGWLLCFGQSLVAARYPALFNAIGYTFGGAGANFSIPDCRGRILAGIDNMGGSAAGRIGVALVTDSGTINGQTMGSAGGSSTHTQATGEVGSHTHTDSGHSHPPPSGAHWWQPSSGLGFTTSNFGGPQDFGTGNTGNAQANIQANAAPSAMAWLQPTIMVNKIIFAGA